VSKVHCGIVFEPGASGLHYYCTSFCVRSWCNWRASSVDSRPKKKNQTSKKMRLNWTKQWLLITAPPSVCIPAVLGALAMWIQNQKRKRKSGSFANPKNKGKSYTTFLKPIVSAEWLRQIQLKYPHAPQPPSGNVSSSTSSSTTCPSATTYTNIPLTSKCVGTATLCLSSDSGPKATNPFPPTHVALDLIELLTNLLYDTCQPDWTTLTTHQQTSLMVGDPSSTLPKKLHHVWLPVKSTLSDILDYVSHFENLLYLI